MSNTQKQLEEIDQYLDANVSLLYKLQPIGQDWARISKVGEEYGEAVNTFIGVTGQNPRKGDYSSYDELEKELLDVAATALLAVQHFDKEGETMNKLANHIAYLRERING